MKIKSYNTSRFRDQIFTSIKAMPKEMLPILDKPTINI